MTFIKRYIFRIILILIILSPGVLCIYKVQSNLTTAAVIQPNIAAGSFAVGEDNHESDISNHKAQNFSNGHGSRPPQQGAPGRAGAGNAISDTQVAPQIMGYSAVFLLLFAAAYYFWARKKIKVPPTREKALVIALLGLGLILRFCFATSINGHPFDIGLFKGWASAASHNLFNFYSSTRCDYPPLYVYILSTVGKIASMPTLNPYYILLLKLPSIIADLATSYLIYKLAKKHFALEVSLLLCAFYIFNPAVLINSTLWGQVDSFFTLIVVASLFLLTENKVGPAAALFAAAVLMKPQGIIFLPVLFFELLRRKSLKDFVKAAGFALSTALIIILPFAWHEGALWIFKLFANTLGEYPYASMNAFNFFSLLGANYTKDGVNLLLFSYHTWGMIFIGLITAVAGFIYYKGAAREFIPAVALIQIAGVFTFSARMHERYLFPAAALGILAFIYLKDKRLLALTAAFSAAIYVNTHSVLFATISGINAISYSPVLIITSLANVLLFCSLVKVLYDIAIKHEKSTWSQTATESSVNAL